MINAQVDANVALHHNLTTRAVHHCLALGYQREDVVSKMPHPETNRVRQLFWRIYIFDKNLSLRLGRAPIIQDYDVDLKYCSPPKLPGKVPWDAATVALIEFSRIQAHVYETLYSPASGRLSVEDRLDLANELSRKLSRWLGGWRSIDGSKADRHDAFEMTFGPTEVTYYSVLTLVHRGAASCNSALSVSLACFQAAQQGLRAHLDYYPRCVSAGGTAMSYYAVWCVIYGHVKRGGN